VRRTEALLSSNENPEPRSYRTASLLQQISGMSKLNTDQREAFARVRDQVTALKRLLDDAVESQIREQHQGLFVQRATADIGRLAKQHNSEALALRVASEQLRRDMEHLHKLLSAIDAQGQIEFDETAAASSGYYRPIARATSEGEKREGGTSGSSERNAPLRRSGGHKRSGDGPAGSISRPSLPAVAPSGVSARGEDRPAASDRTARPDGRGTGSSPPQAERKQSASDRSTRSELKSLLSTPPGSDGRNPPNKS
jgi:hypothetical protein